MSPLQLRARYLLSALSVLVALALIAGVWGWWRIRASLPQLDGTRALTGLSAPVTVTRDSLGVPTIEGKTRLDVARASGFVQAQDRFFQMDILRRLGAGELSEIFGSAALPIDRARRLHEFRRTAVKVLAALPPDQRTLLEAYTTGVNAELTTSPKIPWEYVALRTAPAPWRAEDSLLVIYAMWLDLQDPTARYEQSVRALRVSLGQAGLDFFAPLGNSWDAALDGSTFPPAKLPPFHLKSADPATTAAAPLASEPRMLPGSNAFAVGGAHTASGAALLANDMHLGLNVPNIWYLSVLKWTGADGAAHQVTGVSLPGLPAIIAGSNGHIAWGETNANADTSDVVLVETDGIAHVLYRTPHGWPEIENRSDPIKVKGQDPVPFTARWTEWGPVIDDLQGNNYSALRWNAHDVESTNLNFMELETARTVDEAMAIAHRTGMPNQNLVVADESGAIAWTITGTIPRRIGYDGRQAVSWAFGDRKWDGWLKPDEIPVLKIAGSAATPGLPEGRQINADALAKEGILWSANQRLVGDPALAAIGDNGYDRGARAQQIRDGLRQLIASGEKARPADLLAIELDDRALFLERWQKVLLAVLGDEAVAKNHLRAEMRDAVRQWNGHASVDSAAYRLVRSFHAKLAERALAPFFDDARAHYPNFDYSQFHYNDALWQLIQERPAGLLNPDYKSWDELMLGAVDDVVADVDHAGLPMRRFTWGARNTLRMQHPFSRFLPHFIGQFLDLPGEPLPGDNDMPRVQAPAFGASERMVVSPGHENEGIFEMPGGQSGNPLSPYFSAGHEAWV
ncbi:MAG: penicillin acylase family protein, partial [Lacunisphaera sp.]